MFDPCIFSKSEKEEAQSVPDALCGQSA